jgi:tetratricopeptide (TPR) repeat protein
VTQEFHISVTPVGNGEYLVRTEHVAPGVPLAEEQFFWAVEDWLDQARQLMTDPLVGLLQGDSVERVVGRVGVGSTGEDASSLTLRELGKRLYSKLFQGTLRDSWVIAQGIAQHRKEVLRLRLGLKGSSLLRLPWEVMGEGDRDPHSLGFRTIATGTDIIFSRYQPGIALLPEGDRPRSTGASSPLRILMVIATPRDSDQLALSTEAEHLQQELSQPTEDINHATSLPGIELTILRQPGREQLTQALEQGHYQVLHYAGHSNLGQSGGDLYLVNERTGLTELLSGDDLAGLLVNNGIRMAVFNSCRGGYIASPTGQDSRDRNLAEALVSRGIPAVLAMAERIPDDVALVLTRLFYRNLKHGYPVDLSLSRARQGLISSYGSHQLYWALPTLYLHPDFDGYLYGSDRTAPNPADHLMQSTSWLADLERLKAMSHAAISAAASSAASLSEPLELEDELSDEELPEEDVVANLVRQLEDEPQLPRVAQTTVDTIASPLPTLSLSATPAPSSPRPSAAAATASSARPITRKRSINRKVPLLGAAGLLAIALVGGVWWRFPQVMNGMWTPEIPVVGVEPSPTEAPRAISDVDLDTSNPQAVTQLAISLFNQGDMLAAQDAVETLLNQGAIAEAEAALSAVPSDRREDATVHYLQGRLIWQRVKAGDSSARVSDARTEWEQAVQRRPNEPKYWMALGFAYHAEDAPREAVQSWVQALGIVEHQPATSAPTAGDDPTTVAIASSNITPLSSEMQHLYAGISIGIFELSKRQPPEQQAFLREKALSIRQTATTPPFDPTQSGHAWLWTTPALEQWRALQKL